MIYLMIVVLKLLLIIIDDNRMNLDWSKGYYCIHVFGTSMTVGSDTSKKNMSLMHEYMEIRLQGSREEEKYS
ncbi:hypothetical protein TSUD_103590 [Trifolium subterraneum]|uniref:Uncharacterized protein n=1 Tax=Trifolium subterraneum TaxID=3900 RepID=A0A2Z6MS37_TRISU|nr:hypothetical protein TSUD_103590 [Trifolium subterraneum]